MKIITVFESLLPEHETNVESVSERGTVDISRNSLNPFHVSFHATVAQFHVSCPRSALLPRKTHAKSTLIPRKIHGKKSLDMRESTFVRVRDINITLTVLYSLETPWRGVSQSMFRIKILKISKILLRNFQVLQLEKISIYCMGKFS